jgi:hypothetical protein
VSGERQIDVDENVCIVCVPIAFVVRALFHWLGGRRVKLKRRSRSQ